MHFKHNLLLFFLKSVENDPDQTPHPPSVQFSTLFFMGSGSLIKKWFKTKKKCGNFYKGGGVKVIPHFFLVSEGLFKIHFKLFQVGRFIFSTL